MPLVKNRLLLRVHASGPATLPASRCSAVARVTRDPLLAIRWIPLPIVFDSCLGAPAHPGTRHTSDDARSDTSRTLFLNRWHPTLRSGSQQPTFGPSHATHDSPIAKCNQEPAAWQHMLVCRSVGPDSLRASEPRTRSDSLPTRNCFRSIVAGDVRLVSKPLASATFNTYKNRRFGISTVHVQHTSYLRIEKKRIPQCGH